ncbi:MAG: Mur ligase family protein, partial [Flavobacteriaceae bacterium]
VYTVAIPQTNPQIAFFKDNGYPIKKRAKFLGDLCHGKTTLAIAGTHGKTTTTAFLTHIFSYSDQKFTSLLGGFFTDQQSNLIHKGDEFIIVEADEYDRSFLHLNPTIGGITSMDADHLDIYKTTKAFEQAFRQFSNQISQSKVVAYGLPLSGLTYGFESAADYSVSDIKKKKKGYSFSVKTPKGFFENVEINELGMHNILNALCAVALAEQAEISTIIALDALKTFPGVYRRMNVFEWDSKWIVDDYAHHPTEIKSVLDTLKNFYPNHKNCIIFQPHLFSRTQDFFDDFVSVLADFDQVLLLDIYPAREEPISGVSSRSMLDSLDHTHKKLISKSDIPNEIHLSDASLFAFLGAGDIGLELKKFKNQFITL